MPHLRHVLSTALLAALASPIACGGSVGVEQPGDGGGDSGGTDGGHDASDPDGGTCPPTVVPAACSDQVTYACGLPITLATPGAPTSDECKTLCAPSEAGAGGFVSCWINASETGPSQTVNCTSCAVGRRPADLRDEPLSTECDIQVFAKDCFATFAEPVDLRSASVAGSDVLGNALAEMARIEAASVHAFRRLGSALVRIGAPRSFRDRARSAARDEIRHARIVARLARVRGARPRRVVLDRSAPLPTTFALALENAVEGCVRETLGVAYLAHQRLHAADVSLRQMADALYEDELRHAALSWDLVAVLERDLDDAQRAALREAQRRALEDVVVEATHMNPIVQRALGLPTGRTVSRLVEHLRGTLFAA